jgi:hypothetical protein
MPSVTPAPPLWVLAMQGLRSVGKFLSSKAATLSNVLSGKMALPSDEAMVWLSPVGGVLTASIQS